MSARRLAEAGILAAIVIWAANFVVVKASYAAFGPLEFAALRFALAAATLLVLLRWREGSFRWPGRLAPVLFALGAIGFGGYQVLWALGLTSVTAGESALLVAAAPVFTAVLAGATGMDELTVPKVGGALLAFVGVTLVVTGGQAVAIGGSPVGSLLTLGAAACWAVYTVWATRVVRGITPLQLTAWTVVAGALVLAPFGAAEALAARSTPLAVDAAAIAGLLFSGMLAAAIANVFVMHAITLIGPTRVSAGQFLVPGGALVLGALFLAEPVGAVQVAGGAIIVVGVWMTRRASLVPARVRARLSSRP